MFVQQILLPMESFPISLLPSFFPSFLYLLNVVCFDIGSHYVVQAGFQVCMLLPAHQSATITGVCSYSQPSPLVGTVGSVLPVVLRFTLMCVCSFQVTPLYVSLWSHTPRSSPGV